MYTLVFLVCEHYFTPYYNIEKATTGVVYTIILTSHLTMYYFSERNSISLWRYLLHRNGWFFICKILQKLHLDYPPCMYVVNAKKYICIRICPEKRCLQTQFLNSYNDTIMSQSAPRGPPWLRGAMPCLHTQPPRTLDTMQTYSIRCMLSWYDLDWKCGCSVAACYVSLLDFEALSFGHKYLWLSSLFV